MADDGENEGPPFSDDDYHNGAIRKITFRNFLTYKYVEVVPGPHMNVIIGPNGTGKSTIICGICLASGGSPKCLGRSDNMADYVRHGEIEGSVEMVLKDNTIEAGERSFKVVIRRNNHAVFFIDRIRTTRTKVEEAIMEYNIQVDNPCTFLAQDKVKSFAEQDAKLLLMNTLRSGPVKLSEYHERLVKLAADTKASVGQKEVLETKIKKVDHEIKITETLAANFLEQQKRDVRLNTIRSRIAFFEYENSRVEHSEAKAAQLEAIEEMKKIDTLCQPIDKKIAEYGAKIRQIENKNSASGFQKHKQEFVNRRRALTSLFQRNRVQEAKEALETAKAKFATWDKTTTDLQKAAEGAKESLAKAKEELDNQSDYREQEMAYKKAEQRYGFKAREIANTIQRLVDQKMTLQRQFDSGHHLFTQRLDSLCRTGNNRNIPAAWNFYMANKNQFQCPVYIPYLFIQAKPGMVKQLNCVLPSRDVSMFIFGCREDEDLILKNHKVNSTIVSDEMASRFNRNYELPDSYRELGFQDFVINLFDAPLTVKAYFASIHKVHVTPYGGENVENNCETVAHRLKGKLGFFYSHKSTIEIVISKYNNAVTVGKSPLQPKCSFTNEHERPPPAMFLDLSHIEDKLSEAAEKKASIEGEREEVERLRAIYQEHRRALEDVKAAFFSAQHNKNRIEHTLANQNENKPDVEKLEREYNRVQLESKADVVRQLKMATQALAEYEEAARIYGLNLLQIERFNKAARLLRSKRDAFLIDREEVEARFVDAKKNQEEKREAVMAAKAKLLDVAGIRSSRLDELKREEERRRYAELNELFVAHQIPDNADECEAELEQEEIRNEVGRLKGSKSDVEKLKQLQEELEKLEKTLGKFQSLQDNSEAEMKRYLEKWLKPMSEFVDQISKNFSSYFERIKCAGFVQLDEPEDPLNVDGYGIAIFVRFRGYASMRRLTAQQQSGGERSVSTMFYLMALQTLCDVPFRCVDEINQGMDPTNERLVFNMMVELLSGDEGHLSRTQYFMLTPKLLSGLNFNEKVTVLIIQNSAMMDDACDTLTVRGAPFELSY